MHLYFNLGGNIRCELNENLESVEEMETILYIVEGQKCVLCVCV
jgi:hypothetical protein